MYIIIAIQTLRDTRYLDDVLGNCTYIIIMVIINQNISNILCIVSFVSVTASDPDVIITDKEDLIITVVKLCIIYFVLNVTIINIVFTLLFSRVMVSTAYIFLSLYRSIYYLLGLSTALKAYIFYRYATLYDLILLYQY